METDHEEAKPVLCPEGAAPGAQQSQPQCPIRAPSPALSAPTAGSALPWGTSASPSPQGTNTCKYAPKKAKKKIEGGSNVFSMFEQTQIQEFKEAFTIMDQNRDGFIDKADLRDTFAALGRLNVKNEELEDMVKEAPGPINFTVFLTMFGEKLKGTDPEETILNAFKIFDPEGKGRIKADYIKEMLMTQADRFSQEEINQMFAAFPPDVSGNLDYKNLCYVITHACSKASYAPHLQVGPSWDLFGGQPAIPVGRREQQGWEEWNCMAAPAMYENSVPVGANADTFVARELKEDETVVLLRFGWFKCVNYSK
ncbi:hypothetical protein IHE44_0007554, partial [Lamprotornis superbus]